MPMTDLRTQEGSHFIPKKKPIIEAGKPTVIFEHYSHLKVVGNRVMVQLIEVDFAKTESGVITSSHATKEAFKVGVIVAIGDGYVTAMGQQIDIPLSIGDVAFFDDLTGSDYKVCQGKFGFEAVRLVDIPDVKYIDGLAKSLYVKGSLPDS